MSEFLAKHGSSLDHAREQEKEYDWAGAAETYRGILSSAPGEEPEIIGKLSEQMAYALYKRALQSENANEFGNRADLAAEAYRTAKAEYARLEDAESCARGDRCEAAIAFIRFLRSAEVDERRTCVAESWDHARRALDGFKGVGNSLEFCRTFIDVFPGAVFHFRFLPEYKTRKDAWTGLTRRAEIATMFTRNLTDRRTGAKILALTSALLDKGGWGGLYEEDADKCHADALKLWSEAEKMSSDDALAALPLAWIASDVPVDPQRDIGNEISAHRRALDIVGVSKDRLEIGHALAALSFWANWLSSAAVDKEEFDELMAESLDYALGARDEFLKIGFLAEAGPNMWVMSPQAEFYLTHAGKEEDLRKKRELAEKALKELPTRAALARKAGYIQTVVCIDAVESYNLYELAKTETTADKRRELLQRSVNLESRVMQFWEKFDTGNSYDLGLGYGYLAEQQGELAKVIEDRELKITALRKAAKVTMQSIEKLAKGISMTYFTQDPTSNMSLGELQSRLGSLHSILYELERNQSDLKDALEGFEDSAESYLRAGQPTRAAENLWEAARVYDQLDNPAKAAERFLSASKEFRAGAEKVSRLRELFSEQATYLEGWAEFEEAKHHRASHEYHQSQRHFEKAAELHDRLDKWRFLAPNSRAWAQIDHGEALSREDRRHEASEAFQEAAVLFEKSEGALNDASKRAENADEKRMISRLTNAAGPRRKYCLARAMIEKARQMDVEGMSSSSSDLYKTAADELERLAGEVSSEQDRDEIKLRVVLCRAWHKMNRAEAEVSSEPYAEAALLFEEAKELSANDKAKALALGHSRFCRALEAGTKFADTREPALHTAAVKSLESASAYYVKAGADTCSEYSRASKLLFDAYAYLAEASQEKEQKKAAKTYAKAEKVLQACSMSYDKAGQPGKRDQVLKLLERVKQDRELAVSLMEVLEAPSDASSTAAFSAPSPTQEEAAGLDRFAHADVQATLIVQRKDLKVGEDMDVEIELVNAGRASAVLTKVENIIPSGFEVRSKPANYRIEDSYIMMKGKRLDPLKTEEIALVLKPMTHGRFQLRPRILYLDDEGQYKAQDVEGCDVTVKELGVTGWLKGPERKG